MRSLSRLLRCEKIQSTESLNKTDLFQKKNQLWHRYSLSSSTKVQRERIGGAAVTTLRQIELRCPVCDNEFKSQSVVSTNAFGGKRTDFHEQAAGTQPFAYLIHMCSEMWLLRLRAAWCCVDEGDVERRDIFGVTQPGCSRKRSRATTECLRKNGQSSYIWLASSGGVSATLTKPLTSLT